ncbi:Mss4-like protein [Mycena polygramma]|nr:Mss4-like protein [Mycena polygramma]
MTDSPSIECRGNCHCGAFKFTFTTPELKQAYACTCSFCSKNGYLWAFPVELKVVKGDEHTTLKTYRFGKRNLEHKFCHNCGTYVFTRTASGQIGINIHTLADVDLSSLTVTTDDGAKNEPLYQIPEPVAVEAVPDGATLYHGNCHCGAVGYTLLSLEKLTTATECNCSICSRDGALWVYPEMKDVTFKGLDSLSEYTFATRTTIHGFCKTCGVAILEKSAEGRTDVALNVRTMNDIDLPAFEIRKVNNKDVGPAYEV